MKKILFGIFAHPDDEAFGPSGTLLKMSRDGIDIHLICATNGQAGMNPNEHSALGDVRLKEWLRGGKLIGVSSMKCLDYPDGELNNKLFHDIAATTEGYIRDKLNQYSNDILELSFMTFDSNGISGHIDHIVMSNVASYIFYRFKDNCAENIQLKDLRYFCIDRSTAPQPNTNFVFMPVGRRQEEINITVDVSDIAEQKRAIMLTHQSQRQDAETLLKLESTLKAEHFYVAS